MAQVGRGQRRRCRRRKGDFLPNQVAAAGERGDGSGQGAKKRGRVGGVNCKHYDFLLSRFVLAFAGDVGGGEGERPSVKVKKEAGGDEREKKENWVFAKSLKPS